MGRGRDEPMTPAAGFLPPEAAAHYAAGQEAGRLFSGRGQLERARTAEVIARYLPPPPAVILDIGGGPGAYACALAAQGYTVHLIDALPLHVDQARATSAAQPAYPLASATVGDARHIGRPDAGAAAVLLLGPLYHLTERADRVQALREARRLIEPGGLVVAAAVSRFASTFDALFHGLFTNPDAMQIVHTDLETGQHRNPTGNPSYFTTTFFHHPDELRAEVTDAGLQLAALLAVEGPGWLLPDFDPRWADPARRAALLDLLRRLEGEPALLGASAHILAVCRKTDAGS